MLVKAILREKGTEVVTATPETTVGAAGRLLHARRIGALVILDGDRVAGILSERDIVRGMAMFGDQVMQMPVSDLMTETVQVCSPDDTVEQLMAVMTTRRFRHLPVMDEGRLVGLVSIGDVVKSRIEEFSLEVDSLRNYVFAGR